MVLLVLFQRFPRFPCYLGSPRSDFELETVACTNLGGLSNELKVLPGFGRSRRLTEIIVLPETSFVAELRANKQTGDD